VEKNCIAIIVGALRRNDKWECIFIISINLAR
jgi:hypothetical protein